ncbi:MAG: T9SS type A sorting domain-containing protein [Candidatus Cloacimonetes bacterium]|nr:T9SS type A sorting domain-containing protein [Candidatus Cloacimonadota bacterium]
MTCFASTISKTYYFDEPVLISEGDYSKVHIEDGVTLGTPGDPAIPYIGIRLLLPQNESIVSVSLALKDEVNLGSYILYPKQQQVPLSKIEGAKFTEPNPDIYQSETQFPSCQYTNYSTHYLAGYSLGFLALTPIKYIPATCELSYYKEIAVLVETEYDEAAEMSNRFLFKNLPLEKRLQKIVDNPEEMDDYIIIQTRDDDAYDYIIVTSADYVDDFQPLVDFHALRGFRTKIELISDIYSNYTGFDNQDKLRNYFIDQYSQGPIQFVLLGGDSAPNNPSENIIPHRGLFADPGYGMEDYDIPADMYYACLDRTLAPGSGPDWNNDNDDRWGEPDEADLLAEFYIGRICMNNSTEISNAINKMMLYSETPVADEVKSTLLVGELLWAPPQYPTYTWGGTYMNELISGCSSNGYTTVGVPADWDISTLYEMEGDWTAYDLFTELNLGPNILCHLGHCGVSYCMTIYNSDLTTYNITNNGIDHNFFNGYTQGCYAGSFDNRNAYLNYESYDCFSEKISTIPTAASTFIANSRYGWGEPGGTDGPSQIFNREWIDAFFDDGVYSIGGANQVSKEHAIPFIEAEQVIRWCCYELTVFGDPSLDLWTEEPTNLSPTYPQTIMAGTPEIDVIAPAYSRITVYDDDTIYGYGMTNFLGEATVIFDNIPQEAGIIQISIVAHNFYKYVGDITVISCVVNIFPDSIFANVPSIINIEVLSPDSLSPEVGVNVWAEGLGYASETVITDDNGIANLTVDYPFGPSIQIYGKRPENNYYTFQEEIIVIAEDLTNPDIIVTTYIGLEDTFALNLPGTVEAFVENDTTTLWINFDDSGFFSTSESSYEVTPCTINPIIAIISKSGYNLYQEEFPVVVVYGTISGIVTESENGNVVSNAEVRFYEQGADPIYDDPIFSAITNANGIYEITDEYPVDYYDIYVNKWGYNPYEEFDYFLDYGVNTYNIVLDPVESGLVRGRIFDDTGGISNVTLIYYRSDNGEEYAVVDAGVSGRYSVSLPHYTYNIYVSAPGYVPYRGAINIMGNAIIDYHLGVAALFSNFEDDDGGLTSTPSTGAWQWGEPIGSTIQAYSGIKCWATNLSGYYVNYADWYLDSPEITVPASGIFSLFHYYDYEQAGSGTLYDGGNVTISTDGGSTFTLITPVDGYDGYVVALGQDGFGETNYDWEPVEFDISSYAGEDVILRLHFASDQYVCDHYGWYIDDIMIGDPNSSYEIPVVSADNTQLIYEPSLNQNYPNPVINSTIISFTIPKNTDKAELKIYNIKGQLVRTFHPDTNENSPIKKIIWNGKDESGKSVQSGIYFYRLKVGDKVIDIKKCLVLR